MNPNEMLLDVSVLLKSKCKKDTTNI